MGTFLVTTSSERPLNAWDTNSFPPSETLAVKSGGVRSRTRTTSVSPISAYAASCVLRKAPVPRRTELK